MPDTAKPREPVSPAHDQGAAEGPSVASSGRKRDEPVVWPRDMNAPATQDPTWGFDPEALRNA